MYRSNKSLVKKITYRKELNKSKRIKKTTILRWNLAKKITKYLAFFAISAVIIIKLYYFLINAPFFTVYDPIILGNKVISNKEIYKEVKKYFKEYLYSGNPNIFKIDLRELSGYLQVQFTEIKEVTVERKLPNKIVIKISEKDPIALVNTAYGVVTIDKEGFIFLVNKKEEGSYPIITGINLSKIRLGRKTEDTKIRKVLCLINNIKSINSDLLNEFSEFNINRFAQIRAYTVQEGAAIYFGQDISLNIIKKLLAMISYAKRKEKIIEYIDLRFKNIVVKFKNSLKT